MPKMQNKCQCIPTSYFYKYAFWLVYQDNVEQVSNLKRHWDIRYVKYAKNTDKHNGERALTLKQEFISE